MSKKAIKWEEVKAGQVRPYADSIYQYTIESELHENVIKKFCITFLKYSKNEFSNGCFTGSCNFPFGLESYYKFNKQSENKYKYTVCSPYTG